MSHSSRTSRKGKQITNDQDLVADGKKHKHEWEKRFTTFLYIVFMVSIAVMIVSVLLTAIVIFIHWVKQGSWGTIEKTIVEITKYTVPFILGLLAKYRIIRNK